MHPSLRALCDVTGGFHGAVKNVSSISQVSDMLLNMIAPRVPNEWPIPNPLRLLLSPLTDDNKNETTNFENNGIFVNGGPICSFQQFEPMINGSSPPVHRAMLLYTPSPNNNTDDGRKGTKSTNQPIWCIPESYFPSKKLDYLPPRTAQPILNYTRQYQIIGQNTFDPHLIMRSIDRLEKLVTSNRMLVNGNNTKQTHQDQILQYDVYHCEWLNQNGGESKRPKSERGQDYFPVCVRGAGRQSLSEGDDNVLNIGILHVPCTNKTTNNTSKSSTLTLLPPDPQKLLPLLLQAAEIENRALRKALEKGEKMSLDSTDIQKTLLAISKNVLLDENWRSEFRAYLFRVPPYYAFALRICLRQILPARCQSLISIDSTESLVSQCFSRQCLHKIRNGEQTSIDYVERLERKEDEYRSNMTDQRQEEISYGRFDTRSQVSNYLNALRHMPPPWKPGTKKRPRMNVDDNADKGEGNRMKSAMDR